MEDSKDTTNFRKKVDEKERILIHEISENVANGIQDELGESLNNLVESINNADTSISQIGEFAQKLSISMEAIQKYDFTEKIVELQTVQDKFNSTLNDAKIVLDQSRSVEEQFINDFANVLKEWIELKTRFTETIEQVIDGNRVVSRNLSAFNIKIEELDILQKRMNETLQLLDEKFSNQTDRKFMEITDELKRENESISMQLSNIHQKLRTSPTVIFLSVMTVIIMILQIVSFI